MRVYIAHARGWSIGVLTFDPSSTSKGDKLEMAKRSVVDKQVLTNYIRHAGGHNKVSGLRSTLKPAVLCIVYIRLD